MELKEKEEKIRTEHPLFAALVDGWPHNSQDEIESLWGLICSGYHLGFMRGMTHGLEQQAEVMDFALGKIFGRS